MACIKVNDYIDLGTGGVHNATSYQVALDPEFTQIIDQSLKDTEHVKEWHSMLPMIDRPGNYYADLSALYARIKVHVDDNESPWFVLEPKDQNKQNVTITEDGQEDIHTTSDAIGMV